jgi:hypothetical protein
VKISAVIARSKINLLRPIREAHVCHAQKCNSLKLLIKSQFFSTFSIDNTILNCEKENLSSGFKFLTMFKTELQRQLLSTIPVFALCSRV